MLECLYSTFFRAEPGFPRRSCRVRGFTKVPLLAVRLELGPWLVPARQTLSSCVCFRGLPSFRNFVVVLLLFFSYA